MKILYLILAITFYIIGALIGYFQKVGGDQSKVSYVESKYPILTSLNPLGQPFFTLAIMGLFLYLFFNS
jgi:hypothetical protein|tara:strand:- start:229 stop:435 length:207 start_codon:yes stop_codon:yes gene_type:complete